MTANASLDLVSLDFDSYKTSLKAFMASQALFRDYDFEGSNMNVLMDLLSVNSFKNAFFLNMALSEGFLDSAQLLNSVRSHAKELNYLPRSARSAKATITATFEATSDNQPYIIQKGQSFSSVLKNGSFVFSMPETITVSSANTSFEFTTDIYEGIYIKDSYVFLSDTTDPQPKFQITNPNIDTTSLVVTVFEDGSVLGDTYKYATSLLGVADTTKVFFIQCSAVTGNFEVLFGDGVLGRRPKNGSTILLDYRVTNGAGGNGAADFHINFDPTGISAETTSGVTVTVSAAGLGGAAQEDIETTRFNAPRYFQVQERGAIASDYEILLQTQFPEIASINAYGGEEELPPQFGKVIIALAIANVVGLPTSKIDQYTAFLKKRSMLTITPKFIAPQYTYITVDSTVRYNINITNESINRLKTIVTAAIVDFNTQNLNDFNSTLRFSNLVTTIDQSDPSIISNLTAVQLYKKLLPSTSISSSYVLDYGVSLIKVLPDLFKSYDSSKETVLSSSNFTYKGDAVRLADDNWGTVRIVSIDQSAFTIVQNIGTIDYETGRVILVNFVPDSYDGDSLQIFVRPRDNDVSCKKNTIMTIESAGINLIVEQLQV